MLMICPTASCKGLALPFLVNWLLGDFTNLIGCIFTDQLPFQTYLATYFCFVDAILILQYFHYTRKHKHRLRHAHHHHHHSYSSRLGSQHVYQSITHSSRPSMSRTRSVPTSTQTSQVLPPLSTIHREVSRSSSRSHVHFPDSPRQFDTELHNNTDTPVQMTESSTSSINSDGSTSTIAALTRGRSVFRNQTTSASAPDIRTSSSADALDHHFRQASSGSRPRLAAVVSRDPSINSRTRSVVFLSIWTFVGLGQLFGRSLQYSNTSASAPSSTTTTAAAAAFAWKARSAVDALALSPPGNGFEEPIPLVPIDYSRLVGRLAAWMCVCFYLTSRMPQICRWSSVHYRRSYLSKSDMLWP
jgi:hypothetical protein